MSGLGWVGLGAFNQPLYLSFLVCMVAFRPEVVNTSFLLSMFKLLINVQSALGRRDHDQSGKLHIY